MSITFLIGWVTSLLSNALRARAIPKKQILLEEFARFGLVGFVGFCVDTGIVYSLRYSLGLYGAGLASYVAAATVTWLLNRRWTFKGRESGQLHRQWALFMLVNLGGFLLNRGAYALLVTYVPLCAREPVFAIIPGMLLGMSSNFKLSRNIVFRPIDT
jgi:putative flippase GtrA